ncbi:DsrE family protein [Desulfonatronum thioautotrophicum]|uniref:DsrE family protein n=1 Tax=Desulfonatronum thioautotrophicum TaxID=617001 RepID=UPI0005EBC985|nr:DsrE family protein [Desulfonatronum thioautotrophicum]
MLKNQAQVQLENTKNPSEQDQSKESAMTRGDFLKLAGAGGLGMAAMMGMSSPVMAGEGKKGKYLFVVSAGSKDPDKAMLALLLADVVQKQELGDVHIYLWGDGAELSKIGRPERITSASFHRLGNALGMLERLQRNGAQIGVCPPCAEWVGAVDDQKYEWANREDGGVLLRSMQESWTAWL